MVMKIKGIKDIKYFAKGKRGFVYTGTYKNKKIAIKVKNPESKAFERIKNEAKYLKLLNKHKIGPRFLFFKNKKLVYEFVEGNFILDYINKSNKNNIIKIVKDIFNQMYKLDKLGINKEEMHHPLKHIVINKNNEPVLLDFERAHRTQKPHNVTQFCQFLIGKNLSNLLKRKNIKINRKKIINLARKYKHELNKKNFDEILKNIF